jgi:Protein of unknown function (DUF4019)
MKRIPIALLAVGAFLTVPAFAQDDPRLAAGEAAAETWLALVDAGAYDASWGQSAVSFQAAVPKATWLTGIAKLREPLGKLMSRSASLPRFTDSLAGAPNGEFVSVQYDSEFENKKDAVETVTTKHEPDGSWKVMGYQLR